MPHVSNAIGRRSLVAGLAASVAAVLVPRGAGADGARTGPWCRALSKAAREDAYDITAELLDGDGDGASFHLSDHLGKPVWLQFFTTWCPPCNAEASDVVRTAEKYRDTIVTVGIDVGETAAKVRAFRDRHKIVYPIALDESSEVFHELGLRGYPTHLFFDANGMVSCVSVGDMTPDQFENEIAVALARPPLPQLRTSPSPAASHAESR